jgi:hypothetical protein
MTRLWTQNEDAFIRDNVRLLSHADMASQLNRSVGAVNMRILKLKLAKPQKGGRAINGSKCCCTCGKCKPLTAFTISNATTDGKDAMCKPCNAIRRRKTYYGMTEEQYQLLLKAQDGMCAICGRKPEKLVVDHDHTTNAVRGLLCHQCNHGLGNLQDDTAVLARGIIYLEKHRPAVH